MRALIRDKLFRCAFEQQLAATVTAFKAEVDQVVRAGDDLQVVLDHQDAVAVLDQVVEGLQQLGDVVEVQARGRLIEDEERGLLLLALGEEGG